MAKKKQRQRHPQHLSQAFPTPCGERTARRTVWKANRATGSGSKRQITGPLHTFVEFFFLSSVCFFFFFFSLALLRVCVCVECSKAEAGAEALSLLWLVSPAVVSQVAFWNLQTHPPSRRGFLLGLWVHFPSQKHRKGRPCNLHPHPLLLCLCPLAVQWNNTVPSKRTGRMDCMKMNSLMSSTLSNPPAGWWTTVPLLSLKQGSRRRRRRRKWKLQKRRRLE